MPSARVIVHIYLFEHTQVYFFIFWKLFVLDILSQEDFTGTKVDFWVLFCFSRYAIMCGIMADYDTIQNKIKNGYIFKVRHNLCNLMKMGVVGYLYHLVGKPLLLTTSYIRRVWNNGT